MWTVLHSLHFPPAGVSHETRPHRLLYWPERGELFPKKLRFVFRNFPLTQVHPYALVAAEAAEAAALQGKFWEMHDLLYEQQASLEPDIIPAWAKKIGLNVERLGNDIRGGGPEKRIREDRQSGIHSGVNGTPTFYINGTRYDGSPDYDSLLEALKA